MVSLFLLLGGNLSYIVDLFAALHELASARARTLLKLASFGARALKTIWRHLKLATDFYLLDPQTRFAAHTYPKFTEVPSPPHLSGSQNNASVN